MADPDPREEPAAGLAALLGGFASHLDGLDARRRRDQKQEDPDA